MIGELWETLKSIARPSALLGIAAILIGGITLLISPTLEQYARPLFTAGAILLLVGFIGSLETIRDMFVAPGARYGTNTLVMILVFFGIVIVLNALFFRNSPQLDLTANAQFTLSEQSKQITRNLNQDIQVLGFFTGNLGVTRGRAEDLLRQYQRYSNRLTFRTVDPLAEPALVSQYDIRQDGSIVFEAGERRQVVNTVDEQSFTSALLKVTAAQQKKVYTVVGHGELEYNDFRDTGLGTITNALRNDNYLVEDLNLLTAAEGVPQDAAAIIIAGPRNRFQPNEIQALRSYLNRGGKMMLMYDGRADIGLRELLLEYGIGYAPGIPPGLIIDPSSLPADPFTLVVQRYAAFNEITRNLQATVYPRPGAINFQNGQQPGDFQDRPFRPTSGLDYDLRLTALVQSTDRSWIETTPDRPGRDADELAGPFNIGVQVERFVPLGAPRNPDEPVGIRMVLFTTADFASNQFVQAFDYNQDIVVNSVNWLAGDEQLIAIRPKPADNRILFISAAQVPFVLVSSIVLVPAAVLAVGLFVYWRRR